MPRLILLLLLVLSALPSPAAEKVRIGVLAHRGDETTLAMWTPTALYLSEALSEEFEVVPLDFEEIGPAVGRGEVDFVLANPGIYVTLEVEYGVARIATLNNERDGRPYNVFGGVVFARAGRNDLNELEDLAGRRVMAVDETSLGGFQMVWRELKERGLDPFADFASLEFGGTHDRVVMAVREGRVDAGMVRTDIIERMARAGIIERDEFRIIGSRDDPDFPFVHSTRLYPEWPIAKLRSTPNELAQRVAVALLSMPSNHLALLAGDYRGWTVPLDYHPVHELFQELRIGPYRHLGEISAWEVIKEYRYWLEAIAGLVALMLWMTLWVMRLNAALKRAKHGLERQNELILKAVGDGIYGVDMDGNCTFANPALERITGWSAAELIGRNQHDLLHHTKVDGSLYPRHECPVFATFRDNSAHYVDNEVFWRKDGSSFPVEYVSTPIRDEQGAILGAVVVFRDVTERRQAEERICEHQAELAHAARLSTMGEMASGIAHELNQPLAAIANYANALLRMIRNDVGDKAQWLEVMERVARQAERAGEIIRHIRGFIRKGEPNRRPVSLTQVVRQVLVLMEPEVRKAGVELVLGLPEDLPEVSAYDIQLEQVVLNLARNAIEAMGDTPRGRRRLEIRAQTLSDGVELSVSDRGHGIPDEVLGQLFNPFFTTKANGMGMGLSISRAIIESHEGRLSAGPNPDGGATFSFVLPVMGAADAANQSQA